MIIATQLKTKDCQFDNFVTIDDAANCHYDNLTVLLVTLVIQCGLKSKVPHTKGKWCGKRFHYNFSHFVSLQYLLFVMYESRRHVCFNDWKCVFGNEIFKMAQKDFFLKDDCFSLSTDTWCIHDIEILALCKGNPLVTSRIPAQRVSYMELWCFLCCKL